jgi:hypothetical protein
MSTALAPMPADTAALLERVVVAGDLAKLSPAERLLYYRALCDSLGLNPLTEPFAYITLNGKLKLYALKNATDQLRAARAISITITARERHDDLYVVTARATAPDGRQDEAIGAVPIKALGGEALANALMKGETKAKRRVTLSICSLGMLDETEVDSIPGAKVERAKDVIDVSHLPEAPPEPEPTMEDDPQALADALGERLDACQSLDDTRIAWETVVTHRARFTPAQHQELVVRKDRAKVRLKYREYTRLRATREAR